MEELIVALTNAGFVAESTKDYINDEKTFSELVQDNPENLEGVTFYLGDIENEPVPVHLYRVGELWSDSEEYGRTTKHRRLMTTEQAVEFAREELRDYDLRWGALLK